MAQLSDLIIGHPEVATFNELVELVKHSGESGEMFLQFDVKPDFRDTPRNWQWVLETAFTTGITYD